MLFELEPGSSSPWWRFTPFEVHTQPQASAGTVAATCYSPPAAVFPDIWVILSI